MARRKLYGMGQDESSIPIDYTFSGGGAIAPSGGGFDWSSLFGAIEKGALTGTQIYKSLQSPGLVPGTQAIWNPSTGQFYNPSTGQVVNPQGSTALTSPVVGSSALLIGGLVLGGVLLISMLGKR